MYEADNVLWKLRLLDESDEDIIKVEFNDDTLDPTRFGHRYEGRWASHRIPDGMEIIGMYANTANETGNIGSLGFILWNNNDYRNATQQFINKS